MRRLFSPHLLLLAGLLLFQGVVFPAGADQAPPEPAYKGKPLGEWIKLLEHKSPAMRRGAVEAIGMIGPKAKDAAPGLIKALADDDTAVRREALRSLGKLKTSAPLAAPALVPLLTDHDTEFRVLAAQALPEIIGPESRAVLPDLLKALEEGKKAPLPSSGRFDPNAVVRAGIIRSIGQLGPEAKPALPVLAAVLRDSNPQVALASTTALTAVGTEAVPTLVEALKDPNEQVQMRAAAALQPLGPKAKAAVPALLDVLMRHEKSGRAAAVTLAAIGPDGVPQLTELLKDRNPAVRERAAYALLRLGPPAKAAVPDLIKALNSDLQGQARTMMEQALIAIGPEAVPALVEELKNTTPRLGSSSAHELLARMGPKAKAAVPELIKLLEGRDWEVRMRAAYILGKIGPDAREAAPALTEALQDKHERVRRTAADALQRIQTPSKE